MGEQGGKQKVKECVIKLEREVQGEGMHRKNVRVCVEELTVRLTFVKHSKHF